TTANLRAGKGCTDTDSNSDDFTASTPTPRNSASPAVACGGASALAVHCPADITTDTTNAVPAVVTFTATATDPCDPNPTVTCQPASGSSFSVGMTKVECSAKDVLGNTSSCSFQVTVIDHAPLVRYADAGAAGLPDGTEYPPGSGHKVGVDVF